VLCARGQVTGQEHGKEIRADEYIVKPFSLDEICMRNVLDEQYRNQPLLIVIYDDRRWIIGGYGLF
jgi:DNA-binding response OmpR family regulator